MSPRYSGMHWHERYDNAYFHQCQNGGGHPLSLFCEYGGTNGNPDCNTCCSERKSLKPVDWVSCVEETSYSEVVQLRTILGALGEKAIQVNTLGVIAIEKLEHAVRLVRTQLRLQAKPTLKHSCQDRSIASS